MKRVNKTTDKEKGEVEGWSWVSEDTLLAGLSFLFKVGGEVTVLEETIDRKPDKKRDDLHLDCFHVLAVVKSATMNIGVHESESELTQSCPTLCDPTDYSLPGSSVHGILQARILEWVAISFSRGSS